MKFKPVLIIIAILVPAIFFAGCTSPEQVVHVQKHAAISYIGPLKSDDDYVGIKILIVYAGDWQGSIIYDGNSRSISGTDVNEIQFDPTPDTISINVQKMDGTDRTLFVIIGDLRVPLDERRARVSEEETNAPYGIAGIVYRVTPI